MRFAFCKRYEVLAEADSTPYTGLSVAPDGTVWVANLGLSGASGGGQVRVYDPAQGSFDVARTLNVCGQATAVEFLPTATGYQVYVVEQGLCGGAIDVFTAGEPGTAPANLAYTSYLLRVAYAEPFAELLGALLPCFWIYWEVGKALAAAGSPNPLYQRWIDTYAADEYAASVRQALATMDACAAELSPERRARVARHFVTTSRYEWLFWDAAWRRETWPV